MSNVAYSPVSYRYLISIDPSILPITVDDMRQQAKIDRDDPIHNAWITDFIIRPVVETAERMTRLNLITREYQTFRDNFNIFELRRAPFIELKEFQFYDTSDTLVPVPVEDYYVDIKNDYGYIFPKNSTFPSYDIRQQLSSIVINFTCGFGETQLELLKRNSDIVKAMLQHAVFWYQNRGDCCNSKMEIPPDVAAIYKRRKKFDLNGLQKRG